MAAAGRGFSALNTGLQPPSGPLIATVEVYPEPPSDDAFPDPLAWREIVAAGPDAAKATENRQTAPPASEKDGASDAASSVDEVGVFKTSTSAPSVSGGYRSGKWLWEWRIVSCGNRISVGVCGHDVAVVSAAGVPLQSGSGGGGGGSSGEGGAGSSGGNNQPDLWLYRSDGHLSHGVESTERVCPVGGFQNGDVIGVELDADVGTVAFTKKDSYVGAQFKIVGLSKLAESGGLYPCISLRGSGDAAILLGLKEGPGSITYRPPARSGGGGGGSSERDGKDSNNAAAPRVGEGLAAALTAAVAAATAAAEAVASSAASTVGGGDTTASEEAEAAVASEQDAEGQSDASSGNKSETDGIPEMASETRAAGSVPADTNSGAADSGTGSDSGGNFRTRVPYAAAFVAADTAKAPPPPPPPLPGTVPTSCYPASFHGDFLRGLKHGPGVLRLSGKGGYWKGKWFQGVQHGVQLLVEPPAKKNQVEGLEDGTPTAWLFDRGMKVRYRSLGRLVVFSENTSFWYLSFNCTESLVATSLTVVDNHEVALMLLQRRVQT